MAAFSEAEGMSHPVSSLKSQVSSFQLYQKQHSSTLNSRIFNTAVARALLLLLNGVGCLPL